MTIVWAVLLIAFIWVEASTVGLVSVWFAAGSLVAGIASLLGGAVLLCLRRAAVAAAPDGEKAFHSKADKNQCRCCDRYHRKGAEADRKRCRRGSGKAGRHGVDSQKHVRRCDRGRNSGPGRPDRGCKSLCIAGRNTGKNLKEEILCRLLLR